jgi:hypothetical protein
MRPGERLVGSSFPAVGIAHAGNTRMPISMDLIDPVVLTQAMKGIFASRSNMD